MPRSVARSLAIFQLGESGGGTIVEQARSSRLPSLDSCYAEAMALFVDEEHRHAEILAICVRNLGGCLIRRNWTAALFVFFRRLMGLRLKVFVLLLAEAAGLCYYELLSARLPRSRIRSLLREIAGDERSHIVFHCRFLRGEACTPLRRLLFVAVWRPALACAAAVTLLDHRRALEDLGIPPARAWRRWMTMGRQVERLMTRRPAALYASTLRKDAGHERQHGAVDVIEERHPLLGAVRMAVNQVRRAAKRDAARAQLRVGVVDVRFGDGTVLDTDAAVLASGMTAAPFAVQVPGASGIGSAESSSMRLSRHPPHPRSSSPAMPRRPTPGTVTGRCSLASMPGSSAASPVRTQRATYWGCRPCPTRSFVTPPVWTLAGPAPSSPKVGIGGSRKPAVRPKR